ncbi:hypothetical protein SISNIDRAFT_285599 [Sistotremastrum niveocremeum HHB9708]|uniref:Uncharacterized protein n=1 Tax=Sistotremastrum niveocremeum HHB9708 TaxID=1314777 RepID=A0A164YBL7_9AGAM|nr:hypothetical protein SISNIDRAFT_285599 [Sistotremastrum niveocremeum HHB9708]
MSSTKALSASALASVTYRPPTIWTDNVRVYYVDVYGDVCEARGLRGIWFPSSKTCFKAPRPRTPLAAVVNSEGTEPEIRVYCIHIDDKDVPSIQEYKKARNSNDWIQGKDVPTKDLASISALAAVNYTDKNAKTQLRIYWQDTTHYIRQTTFDGSEWKVSDTKISSKAAFAGTPIGAAAEVVVKDSSTPSVIIAWHDPSHYLVVSKVADGQNPQNVLKDTQRYSASPTGTVTVLAWDATRTWIYYDGLDDGLQRVRLEAGENEEAFSVFTGDITSAKAPAQGALTSAAFQDRKNPYDGFGDGTIFYQVPGRVNIVEIRI